MILTGKLAGVKSISPVLHRTLAVVRKTFGKNNDFYICFVANK
jgi:hypothetical protein